MNSRYEELKSWLVDTAGLVDFTLEPASEDASFRRYFRVTCAAGSMIVMDAPPVHESCAEFIDVNVRLREAGVNAPQIIEQDEDNGFLLLTDFGDQHYLHALDAANADTLYADAIDTLCRMQATCRTAGLPPYDESLLRREMMLFNDWLVEKHIGHVMQPSEADWMQRLHGLLVDTVLEQPRVFVHRDYHSRNLMLIAEHNPGVLDYQDAVYGPLTYDIVSLLKDCYVKWPAERIHGWLRQYADGAAPGLRDEPRLQRWFDLTGVQRHLKASGIFCRLYHRDGKPGYLKDIPRTLSYIVDLRMQYKKELEPLCDFIEGVVSPALEREINRCTP